MQFIQWWIRLVRRVRQSRLVPLRANDELVEFRLRLVEHRALGTVVVFGVGLGTQLVRLVLRLADVVQDVRCRVVRVTIVGVSSFEAVSVGGGAPRGGWFRAWNAVADD